MEIVSQTSSEHSVSVFRMPSIVVNEQGGGEVSIYNDAIATEGQINTSIARVIASYPSLFAKLDERSLQDFAAMLKEAIKFSGMSGQQLHDATINCICTKKQEFQFQISDITSYDNNVKLYTYKWACDKSGFVMSKLKRQVGDTWEYWWCKAQDLEKVNRIAERQNKQ